MTGATKQKTPIMMDETHAATGKNKLSNARKRG